MSDSNRSRNGDLDGGGGVGGGGDPDAGRDGDPDAGGGGETDAGGDDAGGRPCPACGEPMYSRHCKYVCPNHGVVMDCSDTFY